MATELSVKNVSASDDFEIEESRLEYWLPLVRSRANAFRQKGVENEDLIQEGLIGLLYAIRAYDRNCNAQFETFAYTCITNRLRTAILSAGKRLAVVSLDNSFTVPEAACGDEGKEDPQEIFISREQVSQWLEKAKSRLSEFESRAIGLYLGGYSYQEMSVILKSNAKAVDNALQRARRKMRGI